MQGELFTQHALAKHCGWSYQRMGGLLKGVQPRKTEAKSNGTETRYYHLGDVFESILSKAGNEELDAAYERARKDKAQADKTELEIMERKKLVVPANLIERAWDKMVGAFRSRMLNLAPRVVPLLQATDGTYAEMRRVLDEAVYDSLEELSGYRERVGGTVADGEGSEAPAEADSKPVGRQVPSSKS